MSQVRPLRWKGSNNYREKWLRFAAFEYFRNDLVAGRNPYGASNKEEVEGIEDPDRRAAKLARELIARLSRRSDRCHSSALNVGFPVRST